MDLWFVLKVSYLHVVKTQPVCAKPFINESHVCIHFLLASSTSYDFCRYIKGLYRRLNEALENTVLIHAYRLNQQKGVVLEFNLAEHHN